MPPTTDPDEGPAAAPAAARRAPLAARVTAWLNDPEDPFWSRPAPTAAQRRNDVLAAVGFLLVALLASVLVHSYAGLAEGDEPWRFYLSTVLIVAPLALRRRFPLPVVVASSALFLGLTYASPTVALTLPFQGAYFAALYAAVAWSRDRQALWVAMSVVVGTMGLWLLGAFTVTNAYADFLTGLGDVDGPLPQLPSYAVFTLLVNTVYFGGAVLAGRASWRAALQQHRLAAQAQRIREQSQEIARRAVVDERLRIARELHDVVAHHVSVIGIQAGAARTVLARDPAAASTALRTIEASSRTAVGEMRQLLGVLRAEGEDGPPGPGGGTSAAARRPDPGLADIAALARQHADNGLAVEVRTVEDVPGDLDRVPPALGLSAFRCAQESLSNVIRHSTATTASVTLRTGRGPEGPWFELEVLDDGSPRSGTAGTGFGLQGLRERVRLHGGEAEIGPRSGRPGWRVRTRCPLPPGGTGGGAPDPAVRAAVRATVRAGDGNLRGSEA
ncbi:sensor histidine kinase [uncultured Kocuria sp.]|uniref:sensor histidine kinase n=1 Tax=uncultured Kocuria sp. TaxID=259305 RepID=UPI002632FC8B|nr:sensor histidine kinase [uncultured Kocuria sp.]